MSNSSSPSLTGITLDELLALNQEIRALVRAGVPLEFGLGEFGRELPGHLGQVATGVAEQLRLGRPLVEVLDDSRWGIPPAYRAVVSAGLRSGRLASALEAVAQSARRLADLRRTISVSLVYPLLLLIIGWGLLAVFAAKVAPALAPGVAELTGPTHAALFLDGIARWGAWARYWGPALPAALLLAAGWWWFASGRATVAQPRRARMLLGWLPWGRSVLRLSTVTAFAEVLAVLVEHGVPLDEALRLAAEAAQDPRIARLAAILAESLRAGATAGLSSNAGQSTSGQATPGTRCTAHGFPPLLAWLMTLGQQRSALPAALRHAAETYHRQLERQAHCVRIFLPVLATVVLGGGVCLTLALAVFCPWISLLYHLTAIR